MNSESRDVFVCHASEDKVEVAKPLSVELNRRGISVWYDEFVLRVGDSLRREIDRGLTASRFGVVVLSKAFFAKQWPQQELDALLSREVSRRSRLVLPVWHGIEVEEIRKQSAILADRVGIDSRAGISKVADAIIRSILDAGPIDMRSTLDSLDLLMLSAAISRGSCQSCGGEVAQPVDGRDWWKCKTCGWEGIVA